MASGGGLRLGSILQWSKFIAKLQEENAADELCSLCSDVTPSVLALRANSFLFGLDL
jgi:hypothetical protein